MDATLELLGSRLRQARMAARLSEWALANRAEASDDAIRRFEQGGGGLSVGTLVKLARALGIESHALVDPSTPFDVALTPHALLKTTAVHGHGNLGDRDEDALAAGLARAGEFADLRRLMGRVSLLDSFEVQPAPARDAHLRGYDDALRVRTLLPRRGALMNLSRLVEDRFGILVLDVPFEDDQVVGAACRLGDARIIAVRRALPSETWRRFVIGHELEHHLRDLLPSSGEISVFGVNTRFQMDPAPEEKRANAFAAMLLAPASDVTALIGAPTRARRHALDKARNWVEEVVNHFGIGFAATAWHLHNLGYYDQTTAATLIALVDLKAVDGFEDRARFDGLTREVFSSLTAGDISTGRARNLIGEDVDLWLASDAGQSV